MSSSVFKDKSVIPDSEALARELGETKKYLDKISSRISEKYGNSVVEWKYYGQKSGWIMKLLLKKKNIFFMIPQENGFDISFVFGDKAVEKITEGDFPDVVKKDLIAAKKYAEGRGLRLNVSSDELCDTILDLAEIKLS